MADTVSKHIDMTTGSLWRNIPLFAFPVAATSILEQLSNLIATVIIGNFSGDQGTLAMAAVGSNVPLTSLMLNLFIGMSLGSNVVIANAIGRNDQNMVKRAVHTSILMALVGFVVIALGEIFAEPMLAALNVPAETMPLASLYLRVFLLSMPSILLYNFEAAIFRSIGDTKVPLAALAVSGVLNVLLNLFFVIVLHMTVNGVAIATVAANAVSAALLYVRLTRTDKCVRVERKALRIDGASLKRILSIGLPAGVQSAVFSFANIVIQSAINSLGTVVMAASSAAFNIEIIAYDVLNSFSQACTTFVGQNYGAGQIDRCRKALKLCLIESVIATACAVCIALLSGKYLIALFNNDPEVIRLGMVRLKFIFMSYIFSTIYDCMSGYMRGFGISLTPALLTIFGVCGTRIIWIYTVFPASQTFETIMQVYPISLAINMVLIFCALIITRPSKRYDHVVLDS